MPSNDTHPPEAPWPDPAQLEEFPSCSTSPPTAPDTQQQQPYSASYITNITLPINVPPPSMLPRPNESPAVFTNIIIVNQVVHPEPHVEEAPAADAAPPVALTRNQRTMFLIYLAMSIVAPLFTLIAAVTPWFVHTIDGPVFCKTHFLWLFLIAPASTIGLAIGGFKFRFEGHLSVKCWSIVVLTLLMPSFIMFTSFGSSLVSSVGLVQWTVGAFCIVVAHLLALTGGLFCLKFCNARELAQQRAADEARRLAANPNPNPNPNPDRPPPQQPITVMVTQDGADLLNKDVF
eukprot:TRINITY_DN2247_c0_g1_i2.p1 TRINITY_DN2247_c0_g1~~TRINITY_DN2247_c0_g1_i2.p1  ORF type:complete len:300 (-),score=67.04 TRINITY_DN2247_c0_g1_i2:150-1019(-)